ncbi:MAG: GHKL domain-containing protein [Ignavibacteriae bacterium]|nr:MAG: GHKL domain-containing protein [Ignavibacteriota bacterium]
MTPIPIKDLKKIVAFTDLPDEHLQWIAERLEYHEYADGELMIKKDDPADTMWFIPEGRFDYYLDVNGQQVYYYNFQNDSVSGGVGGLLPYSRMKASPGYAYAVGKTIRYSLHKKYFKELEQLNPAFIQRLIGYMTERARAFATTQLQHEKVSALGKLAAGIAHEMNNPASAITRISSELSKRLNENYLLTEKLLQCKISAEHIQSIRLLVEEKEQENKEKLTPIQRMQKEDEIYDWLENNDLTGNNIAVETFTEAGIIGEDLDGIRNGSGKEEFIQVLRWVENLLFSHRVIKDLEEASMRISNLVGAIKSHVHMDQTNELQTTDIHRGIEDTLTLMGYKLREKNITVKKIFAENLSGVPAYIGELNQVWTNIIDNAIYALPKNGELTIETASDNKNVYVKIIDNGSGIPPEILSRIFDPFFTTKKVGEGTGIGLDLVNRIIKHHNGEIKVNSKPGRTELVICIPNHEINKT